MSEVFLPRELLELQVGQVDLLQAMYASDSAVWMDESSSHLLEALREWCEGADADKALPPDLSSSRTGTGKAIPLVLTLFLPNRPECSLQLDVSVPLVYSGPCPPVEPPRPTIRLRQPGWLSKAETARLTGKIPGSRDGGDADDDADADGDLLSAIDRVMSEAETLAVEAESHRQAATSQAGPGYAANDLSRIWFYFPSISTRAKRDDIVNHAPTYGLTGFLLAGKPGMLCLEGSSRAVYDYMSFIKTESWSDIPPQHKKVSERYRETAAPDAPVTRAFDSMTEITDLFEDNRRGVRANRNDMRALETWMTDHGVGHAFEHVFI
ncbi:Protein of unknown function (DUF1115) [Geosmithia morbida]|uniref:Small nuclear ribonucleoprotein Prp3 C-terminal domain-containing protein n=1 Tax=Geosmithia morbida TaxID=1094350 RepID=A0A9P4YS00_9HYPO|nr:Protein of unknown function (DUF1115) [Geosmithia morbida]KAF4120643.1 Protein of unknown function (DUF1115) [Geosmithia morbida]